MGKPEEPDTVKARPDGKTDNYYGESTEPHGHTVVNDDGSIAYQRTSDGTVHLDDRK